MENGLYKYDTHMHTAESSRCGASSGARMAETAKALGYDGIIIADHFLNSNTPAATELPWYEKVEILCLGYEAAKKRGDEIGLDVFFAWEYTIAHEGNDLLIYNLDAEWIAAHPETMTLHVCDFCDLVHEHGGFIVHAHPFRQEYYIKMIRLLPDKTDAVETANACRSREVNQRAQWYARTYGLPETGGSDSHSAEGLRKLGGGILVKDRFVSVADYASAVRERRIVKILTA